MKKRTFCSLLLVFSMLVCMAQTAQKHTVQRGETMESIARKYGVTVEELKAANPDRGEFFYVGLVLNVPQPETVSFKKEEQSVQVKDTAVYIPENATPENEVSDPPVVPEQTAASMIEPEDGFLEQGTDYLFLLRPKDKFYGLHYGAQLSKYVYMAFDGSMSFVKDYSTAAFYWGLGWGSKYRTGPILLQGSVYPYGGFYSYDVPDGTDKYGKMKTKNKTKFSYGIQANLGAGFNIHTGKKKGGKTYLTVGYYMTAHEFKTDGMVKNGTWMVGITTDF